MTTDTVGGVWTYSLELARGLSHYDVRVDLATMGKPLTEEERREALAVGNITLHESVFRLEWMDDPWDDVERAGEWLLALEAETGPDLVHLNGYVHGSLPWRSPRLVVAHSCVVSWWQAVKREPVPEGWNLYRHLVGKGIVGADMVVAPTRSMLREIETWYHPPTGGRVIHNARQQELFNPGNKEPFILSVGRLWDPAKNLSLLAEVAPTLTWPVLVAGSDRHPDGASVVLPGLRHLGQLTSSELAPWFSAAALYVLPARYEPFGLTVLEAALSGCALVIGDIPSLRELWDGAALFISPDDPVALRNGIQELCGNRTLREEMAAKALAKSRLYKTEKMAAEYMAAYGTVRTACCHGR